MADQALSGMRVIDLTESIAGPAGTKRLADYGADVIKVEPPGRGDEARSMGPFFHDEPHPEKSGMFLYLNTNKRGITLNLDSRMGREILLKLVANADALVESYKPGVMERRGLSYDELCSVNPRLVMTSLSNFGQTGPYKDYETSELITSGMGGYMHTKGRADREPVKYGATTSLYYAGALAAMATVVAYYGARRHGTGEYVDISVMEALAGSVDGRLQAILGYQYTGRATSRAGTPGGAQIASGMFPCADGYVYFSAGGPRLGRVTEMMGNPPELRDPKFYDPVRQREPAVKDEYETYFLAWLMSHTKQEVFELGQATGNICSAMYTIGEVLDDPQVKARDLFVDVDHPMTGKVKYPGRPFVMEETPWALIRPAPLLGQHNTEVYSELGYTKADLVTLRGANII